MGPVTHDAMVVTVLTKAPALQDRRYIDDALFYAKPRFVQHLDAAFRARLTRLYRERIPPCAVVLNLNEQLGESSVGRRPLRWWRAGGICNNRRRWPPSS